MKTALDKLRDYLDNPAPTVEEAREVFTPLTIGTYDDVHIAALLATIRTRGTTVADIAGAAQAFLSAARRFPITGEGILDTAGTGGDNANTINISTGASLVTAAGGNMVIKHGNRSVSSKSGSADVLEALNIPLDLDVDRAERQARAANFTFLFAPAYHPAIALVMPVRKALKVPTLFNILGPLLSPAKPKLQVMGVNKPTLGAPVIEVMKELERDRALVIHGSGTDEFAVHGPTQVWELRDGNIEYYTVTPRDFDIPEYDLTELAGGDGAENARLLRAVFAGDAPQAHIDAIAINAAAMFYLHGRVETFRDGTELAKQYILDGTVQDWLQHHEEANYG